MISTDLKIRKSFAVFSSGIESKLVADGTSLTKVRDAINAELGKGKTSVDQDKGITLGATRGRKTGGARTKLGVMIDVDNEDFTLPLRFKEWNDMRLKEEKSYPGSQVAAWPTMFVDWLSKMTHQPKAPEAPAAKTAKTAKTAKAPAKAAEPTTTHVAEPTAEPTTEYTDAQCLALFERDMAKAAAEVEAVHA